MFEGLNLYERIGNPWAGERIISGTWETQPEGAPDEVAAEAWAHLVSNGAALSGAGLERTYAILSRRGLDALTSYLGGRDIGDAWIYYAPDGSRWRIINPFRWRYSPEQDGDPVLVAHRFGDLSLADEPLLTQELQLTYPITGQDAEEFTNLTSALFAVSPSGDRATVRVGSENSRPEAWLLLTLSLSGGQLSATLEVHRDRSQTRSEVIQSSTLGREPIGWDRNVTHEYSFTGDQETGTHEWTATSVTIQPTGPTGGSTVGDYYIAGVDSAKSELTGAIVGVVFSSTGEIVEYTMDVLAEAEVDQSEPTGWVSDGGYTWQAQEPDPQRPEEVYDVPLQTTQTATSRQVLRCTLNAPGGGSLSIEAKQEYSWSRVSSVPFFLLMRAPQTSPENWFPVLDRTDDVTQETATFADSTTIQVDGVQRADQSRSGEVPNASGLTQGGDGAEPSRGGALFRDEGLNFETEFQTTGGGMIDFGVRATVLPITHSLLALHAALYIGGELSFENLDFQRLKGYLSHLSNPTTETRDGVSTSQVPRGSVHPGTAEVAIEPEGAGWSSIGWV